MKKLIFIDNDQERDVDEHEEFHVYHTLKKFGLTPENVTTTIRGFWHKCKEEGDEAQAKMMFEDENLAIATYSMYTTSHYGSLFSFQHFLNVAGRWRIKNKVYLNLSSEEYMVKALEYSCKHGKSKENILRAVARNYLISYNHDLESLTRAVVDLSQDYAVFRVEPISLEEFTKLMQ